MKKTKKPRSTNQHHTLAQLIFMVDIFNWYCQRPIENVKLSSFSFWIQISFRFVIIEKQGIQATLHTNGYFELEIMKNMCMLKGTIKLNVYLEMYTKQKLSTDFKNKQEIMPPKTESASRFSKIKEDSQQK